MPEACGADAILGSEADIYHDVPFYARHDNETDEDWFTRRGQLIADYGVMMMRELELAEESGNPLAIKSIWDEIGYYQEPAPLDIIDRVDKDADMEPYKNLIGILRDLFDKEDDYGPPPMSANEDFARMLIELHDSQIASGEIHTLLASAQSYAVLLMEYLKANTKNTAL